MFPTVGLCYDPDTPLKWIAMDSRKDIVPVVQTRWAEAGKILAMLYERSPLGYQSLDAECCLLDVNRAWLGLLGYEHPCEVIGRWFGDLLDPATVDAFLERFAAFKVEAAARIEVRLRHRSGGHRSVILDGLVEHDEGGGFLRTHCILHDITEQCRASRPSRRPTPRRCGGRSSSTRRSESAAPAAGAGTSAPGP